MDLGRLILIVEPCIIFYTDCWTMDFKTDFKTMDLGIKTDCKTMDLFLILIIQPCICF